MLRDILSKKGGNVSIGSGSCDVRKFENLGFGQSLCVMKFRDTNLQISEMHIDSGEESLA